jgi:hypothetical protein
LATEAVALDGNFDAEALEVDNSGEDEPSRNKVHDVGKAVTVEGLLKSATLVIPGEEKVEKRNNGSFEFRTTTGVDGCGTERLPDDRFTYVGSDEQRDTRPKTIAFLEELVEEDNYECSCDEL